MKCKRLEMDAEVVKYEVGKGMEDGHIPYKDVVTAGFVMVDNLITIVHDDGVVVCPYVSNRRGCTFISEGDYIIVDDDGTKHVCGEDKIWTRYAKV